jgi:hypothetical protein
MLHSASARAGGRLACFFIIACGLVVDPLAMARAATGQAFQIPPEIDSLLSDQHACWQLEFYDVGNARWQAQAYSIFAGQALRDEIN